MWAAALYCSEAGLWAPPLAVAPLPGSLYTFPRTSGSWRGAAALAGLSSLHCDEPWAKEDLNLAVCCFLTGVGEAGRAAPDPCAELQQHLHLSLQTVTMLYDLVEHHFVGA
ncbi:hypothetical protein G5714_011255 [Onychostoma macrolepis]|uniref:Uncharacterized protein n=1 Tax=Onychostoma macrolepis TaxID=369639 RepID=A0A7J6CMS1_9TELE|nr:hypothetical protein G5714_011255 [Onychostoma macrolepis]